MAGEKKSGMTATVENVTAGDAMRGRDALDDAQSDVARRLWVALGGHGYADLHRRRALHAERRPRISALAGRVDNRLDGAGGAEAQELGDGARGRRCGARP